jgi:hypothetical protein
MMDLLDVQRLAYDLAEKRRKVNAFEEELKQLKIERDLQQAELIQAMHAVGFSSIKAITGETFIVATRKTWQIADEGKLGEWLLKKGYKDYFVTSLDKKAISRDGEGLAGQECPGLQLQETEYMSIRNLKEEK